MTGELLRRRLLVAVAVLCLVAAIGLPAFRPLVAGPTGVAVGLLAGLCVFVLLAGRPRLPASRRGLLRRALYLTVGASLEELLWRGFALAALVPLATTAAALALTSVAFALAHLRRLGAGAAVHLLTGGTFGGAFVIAGLPAAVAAHAGYNVLVELAVRSGKPRQ